MMVISLLLLVIVVLLVSQLIKTSGNLGVNSYQLEHNTLQHLILQRLSSLIISTLVFLQLVIFITPLILQTGIRELLIILMKFVIWYRHLMATLQVIESLQLDLQQPISMQTQLLTEEVQLHQ